jgi:RHS repeat-associated protein
VGLVARHRSLDSAWDFFVTDAQGSVRVMTDGSGATRNTYAYDAFGELRSQSGSDANDLQYLGEQRDGESGYAHLGARYYDADTGRFLSPDPIARIGGAPQFLNRYAYAHNNPATLKDPSGLHPIADVTSMASGGATLAYEIGAIGVSTSAGGGS